MKTGTSLTDAEIIKALECCSKELGCTKGCPFLVEKNGKSKCEVATPYGTFEKLLLDLINRLKAENKNCGVKIQNQRDQLKACNEKIKEQQAEIERLTKENEILSTNADTAFQDGLNEAQELYAEQIKSEVKSEAYKEFAKRLLRKATIMRDETPTNGVVRVGHIYETLEEMGCGE